MNKIKKVIIIGAGPAGVAAALRLYQEHQISCTIYEIHHEPTTLGGAVGIPSNGLRLLQRLNLYEKLAARGAETSKLTLHSSTGNVMGTMDMTSWSRKQTGFGYLRIRRTDLMDVMLEAAAAAGIPIVYGKQLVEIEEKDSQITASFSDHTADAADFILGCDGINSSVRKLYVDPACVPEYSGTADVASLVSIPNLSSAITSVNGLHATLTSDGLFVISPATHSVDQFYWFLSRKVAYPMPGCNHDVWEDKRKEIEDSRSYLLEILGDSDNEWVKMLRDVVSQTEVTKFYPIYQLPTGRPWSKGRCLIIGDAAHAIPPHASQGVSMALEDVFLFSKLLHSDYDCIETALRAYEKKRKTRTEQALKTTQSNGAMRKKTSPWRLRAIELAVTVVLWGHKVIGLGETGFRQKDLVYDVDEDKFFASSIRQD